MVIPDLTSPKRDKLRHRKPHGQLQAAMDFAWGTSQQSTRWPWQLNCRSSLMWSTRIYRLDLDSSGWMDPIQQSLRCFVDFGGKPSHGDPWGPKWLDPRWWMFSQDSDLQHILKWGLWWDFTLLSDYVPIARDYALPRVVSISLQGMGEWGNGHTSALSCGKVIPRKRTPRLWRVGQPCIQIRFCRPKCSYGT